MQKCSKMNHCLMQPNMSICMHVAHQAPLSMGFSRQDARVGCHALLHRIFLTQG